MLLVINNSILICYGSGQCLASGWLDLYFPVAYTSSYSVNAQIKVNAEAGLSARGLIISDTSTLTAFKIKGYWMDISTAGWNAQRFNYITIGY